MDARLLVRQVKDLARAGFLPPFLQGNIRALTALPLPSRRNSGRPLGLVTGLPRPWWEAAEAAYPEWDLLFARAGAEPDHLAREARRLDMAAIFGPLSKARTLAALRASGARTLYLSPAPLPRLDGPSGAAQGFVLEAMAPWTTARRQTDMEVLLASGVFADGDMLLEQAGALTARLALPTAEPDTALFIEPGEDGEGEPFHVPTDKRWFDADVIAAFDTILRRTARVVSRGHPLAAMALLRGREVAVDGPFFLSGYGLTSDRGAAARPGLPQISRELAVAACVLWAARYVHGGRLVDPLAFTGST